MNLSEPPATGNAELDRWLFLLWKQVQTPTVTAAPDQPAFVVDVPHGGSGASSLSGYLKGNGASPFTASTQIPYSDISGTPNVRVYGPNIDVLDQTATTGIYAVTAYGSSAVRTMTGTLNRISVTNGDGVAGNPTFDISAAYVGQTSITTLGTITTGVWNAGALTTSGDLTVAGISSFAAGAVGAPSIARTGDLSTGVWFPAAKKMSFSANGNEILRLDAAIGLSATFYSAVIVPSLTCSGSFAALQLVSTVAIGSAPITVTSTTLVANLYVARAALADTATTNANLTGPITSSGNATSIASQTGTGTKFVVDTSPTLVTPNIGAATGTSLALSGAGSANTLSATTTITAGTTVQGAFMTATTLTDALFSCVTTGTNTSSRFQIIGRQASVDNEWNIVSPGSGLSGADLRFVSGGWTATPVMTLSTGGKLAVTAPITLKSYTVAGLPAGTNNDTAFVTDALAPAFGAAVAGGGAVRIPVYYDGAWKAG